MPDERSSCEPLPPQPCVDTTSGTACVLSYPEGKVIRHERVVPSNVPLMLDVEPARTPDGREEPQPDELRKPSRAAGGAKARAKAGKCSMTVNSLCFEDTCTPESVKKNTLVVPAT
jgi:hypothetical protein